MPYPFTGPKVFPFCAGPNFLCQTKRWFAFSKIGFCAGTKGFEEALNAVKFLDWLKKFGLAQNILGPVKRQGIRASEKDLPVKWLDFQLWFAKQGWKQKMLCGNFYNMAKVLQNKIENTFFKIARTCFLVEIEVGNVHVI